MTTAVSTVRGAVTRWIDTAFPGWVEVVSTEANGDTLAVIGKLPVLGVDVACEVLSEDGDVVVVRLLYDIADDAELHMPAKSLRR
ncbi:MAG TPA: hypothetical protein VJ914_32875 [Pseudonocardiaceae bacterium]|nr:hypothetical protein [Pseudonocardiaceae bacterium]